MGTNIDEIATRFSVEKQEVEKIYQNMLRENIDVIGLPEAEAKSLALDQTHAVIARRKISGRDAFEGVIFGTDGRVTDWAQIALKKHAEKIKGVSIEDQVKLGYITSDNKPCYIEDRYRTGPIPKTDVRITYYGIFKDGTKWKYASVNLKTKEEMKNMPLGMLVRLEAFKTQASTEEYLNLSINSVRYEAVSDTNVPLEEYYERAAKKFGSTITSIETSENKNKLFCLKNKIIREVRYDVGGNKSTLVTVDEINDHLGFESVALWMPPKEQLKVTLREMLPANFLFTFAGYDGERKQFTGNGIAVWYDEKYKPKEIQPPSSPVAAPKAQEAPVASPARADAVKQVAGAEDEDSW